MYFIAFMVRSAAVEAAQIVPDVLGQGAPQSHVDDLMAPADTQHRLAQGQKGPQQLQLRHVTVVVDVLGTLILRREQVGGDIPTAGQEQPVVVQGDLGTVSHRGQASGGQDGGGILGAGVITLTGDQDLRLHGRLLLSDSPRRTERTGPHPGAGRPRQCENIHCGGDK